MDYMMLKHTHTLLVTLFVLSMLIKTILLLMNKLESLSNYRKKMMVPEMIIATLFLITGLWMFVEAELYTYFNWYWVKILLVLSTIPLGIVAFKKQNKILGIIVLIILIGIMGYAFSY